MSTPNPLIPQGSFQSQSSNVRIAVATIVAIHVVFFGGLLLQGCKRDAKLDAAATNTVVTNLTLPPIDSGSLYYSNAASLPADSTTNFASSSPNTNLFNEIAPTVPNTALDPWQSTNLASGIITPSTSRESAGPMKEHTVVRGDTFGKIAKANGTTVSAMRSANPNVDPVKIQPGMKLNVPLRVAASTTTSSGLSATSTATKTNVYTVKSGDNLTRIARNHGVTVGQLRSANNLKTGQLKVGQKLKIPARTQPASQTAKAVPAPNPSTVSTNLVF